MIDFKERENFMEEKEIEAVLNAKKFLDDTKSLPINAEHWKRISFILDKVESMAEALREAEGLLDICVKDKVLFSNVGSTPEEREHAVKIFLFHKYNRKRGGKLKS